MLDAKGNRKLKHLQSSLDCIYKDGLQKEGSDLWCSLLEIGTRVELHTKDRIREQLNQLNRIDKTHITRQNTVIVRHY